VQAVGRCLQGACSGNRAIRAPGRHPSCLASLGMPGAMSLDRRRPASLQTRHRSVP
jgi:hypothetical protein